MDQHQRPIILVTGRQRPHEVLLIALSALVGAGYTFGAPPPTSVASLMPAWLVHAWAAGLLLSGVVGLVSLAVGSRRIERRMRLEAGSMLVGAAAVLVSTEATFHYAFQVGIITKALLSGGFGLAWTAANLTRAFQIRRELRDMREHVGEESKT